MKATSYRVVVTITPIEECAQAAVLTAVREALAVYMGAQVHAITVEPESVAREIELRTRRICTNTLERNAS